MSEACLVRGLFLGDYAQLFGASLLNLQLAADFLELAPSRKVAGKDEERGDCYDEEQRCEPGEHDATSLDPDCRIDDGSVQGIYFGGLEAEGETLLAAPRCEECERAREGRLRFRDPARH